MRNKTKDMSKSRNGFFYRAFDLYYDGFKHMTLGKTLWAIIIIKLLVIFLVLKLFFFPDYIKEHAKGGDRATFVSEQVMERNH